MIRLCAALALLVLLLPVGASAHKASDSYLTLHIADGQASGQWDIALRDLDYAIGLDTNDDGVITWGELKGRQAAIADYAFGHLAFDNSGARCDVAPAETLIDRHSDGAYAVLRFGISCPGPIRALGVDYDLLFDLDPQHRGLLRVETATGTQSAVLGPDRHRWSLAETGDPRWRAFRDYLVLGIWHIWTGFDHMLFLAALLLPAVLKPETSASGGRRWTVVASFGEALREVLKIVTAFTLAHSITLSLAVFGWIALPSRLVESAIAASVVAAALNNLYPIVQRRLWLVAFGFGLIHGLGFANVLTELGLPDGALLIALASFNLGVETGQLAIVAAFLPTAFLLRRRWFYSRLALGAGSAVIAVVAAIWLAERSLDISVFS
jgi:hypothetical protein